MFFHKTRWASSRGVTSSLIFKNILMFCIASDRQSVQSSRQSKNEAKLTYSYPSGAEKAGRGRKAKGFQQNCRR